MIVPRTNLSIDPCWRLAQSTFVGSGACLSLSLCLPLKRSAFRWKRRPSQPPTGEYSLCAKTRPLCSSNVT